MGYGKHTEKLCPHERGKFKRYVKRAQTKIRRLRERKDPENAPTKNSYKGWTL